MTDVTIRPASRNDAPLLHALASACPPLDVHTPYTYWVLAHMFADGCFVAYRDGEDIGFVTTVRNGDTAFLWQIGVRAEHRGQGISTLLISRVVDWAIANNVERIQLSIDPNNDASLGTFRGFCAARNMPFDEVGSLELRIASDPSFSENEDIFEIKLT